MLTSLPIENAVKYLDCSDFGERHIKFYTYMDARTRTTFRKILVAD